MHYDKKVQFAGWNHRSYNQVRQNLKRRWMDSQGVYQQGRFFYIVNEEVPMTDIAKFLADQRTKYQQQYDDAKAKLDEAEAELRALDAYEAAKTPRQPKQQRAPRQSGKRNEVLSLVSSFDGGATRAQLIGAIVFNDELQPFFEGIRAQFIANMEESPNGTPIDHLAGTPFAWHDEDAALLPVPFETYYSHAHVVAGTGVGKTVFLAQFIHFLVRQEPRPSIIVVDPHRDLINQLKGVDNSIYIDPRSPPSVNPFTTDMLDYLFSGIVGAEFTTKQNVFFKMLARLIRAIPNATTLDYEHEACKQFADAKSLAIGYSGKGVLRGKLAIRVVDGDGKHHWIGIDPATTIVVPRSIKAP